jgi:hypothetical protein
MEQRYQVQGGGKRFYTVEELAERWHCEPQTVRSNWRKWGLRGAKFGKKLIFDDATVRETERRRIGTAA